MVARTVVVFDAALISLDFDRSDTLMVARTVVVFGAALISLDFDRSITFMAAIRVVCSAANICPELDPYDGEVFGAMSVLLILPVFFRIVKYIYSRRHFLR